MKLFIMALIFVVAVLGLLGVDSLHLTKMLSAALAAVWMIGISTMMSYTLDGCTTTTENQ